MKRLQWLGILATLLFIISPVWGENQFDHTIKVRNMSFKWTVQEDQLAIELSAETNGWVAVGFNPSEAMKDANFILGYVKNGKVIVTDHFGITKHQHKADKKLGGDNHFTDITGNETDDTTTIGFKIPLNSGDENDTVISPDKETTVLLAYGSGRDSFRTRHKFRTALKVNLMTGEYTKIK